MDKKNLSVSLVIGLVAIVASVLLGGSSETVIKEIREGKSVGAVASPDIMSPYISFGGQQLWAQRSTSLAAASTTLCAVAVPPSASSTLIKAGMRIDTATGTAATMQIYKSASPWVSTTLLAQDALAASTAGALLATSTAFDTTFSSGDYLIFKLSQLHATAPNGACFAVWSQL